MTDTKETLKELQEEIRTRKNEHHKHLKEAEGQREEDYHTLINVGLHDAFLIVTDKIEEIENNE